MDTQINASPLPLPSLQDDCLPEGRVAVDLGKMTLDHTNPDLTFIFDTVGFSQAKPLTAIRTLYFDCRDIAIGGTVTVEIPQLGMVVELAAGTQGYIPFVTPIPTIINVRGLNSGGNVTDGDVSLVLYNYNVGHQVWPV